MTARNPWAPDTIGAEIHDNRAQRARDLAEAFHNGNRTTVADELTEPTQQIADRAYLIAETLQEMTATDREALTQLLANRGAESWQR